MMQGQYHREVAQRVNPWVAEWPLPHEMPQHPRRTPVRLDFTKTWRNCAGGWGVRAGQLGPWRGGKNDGWWTYQRGITYGCGGSQEQWAARLYVNGNGHDHELRFYVWDIASTTDPVVEGLDTGHHLYGAANSFRRVTLGLLEATKDQRYAHSNNYRIGARGLYGFTKADVLTVAYWADTMVARLYGLPHDPDTIGGTHDLVEELIAPRKPPREGSTFLDALRVKP